jgi:murein DD-endopeptidase MepM/ murein hydrolase activator NlpD
MRRVLLGLALAVVTTVGTASADTFQILPQAPVNLPSASVPNQPGQISVPTPLSTPPAASRQLSFQELTTVWQGAGNAYGIPWQVLAAINKVESNFGRNMGPSSAGAVGWMQFMPSTWARWGVDANGDGIADPWNPQDAIYAAARYLAASGGSQDIARAVLSYNHAQWYVNEVLQLAQTFGSGGVAQTYQLDQLQVSLDKARSDVVQANKQLLAAELRDRILARAERRALLRTQNVPLLSAQLELQKAATLVGVRHHAASVEVARLRTRLSQAENELGQAGTQVASAPAAAATPMFGAPTAQGNYVFPVGGGPSVVSAAHTHHDYPAVDIAAPEGSPEYALSDAVVLKAWSYPDPRCGIGITLRTRDGLTWTYCHLSYLEPTVTAGAVLSAGAPVGLVGHTGDATGPHLHLQLAPPRIYPQSMPWFRHFAGLAFRWQDAPTPQPLPASTRAPVFVQVPNSSQPSAGAAFVPVPNSSQPTASSQGVVRFTR